MERRQTASPVTRQSPPSPDRRQQSPDIDDGFFSPFDDEAWDVFLPDGDLEPLPDFSDLWWDTSDE